MAQASSPIRLASNSIQLGAGITTANVSYARLGDNLIIKYSATDSVTVTGHFAPDVNGALTNAVETLVYTGGFKVDLVNGIKLTNIGGDANDVSLGWRGNDFLQGNIGNDTLFGFGGNDILNGGAGEDAVYGGQGDDLAFGGGSNDLLVGDEGNDRLVGDAGNDRIEGGLGNDSLEGGLGIDNMIGGNGDDIYTVDATADVVTELAGEGTDTVLSSISYSLGGNVENLTLTGAANINGFGDAVNNVITGNTGNNVLDGGAGNDQIAAGAGDDTINFTFGQGTDTVAGNAGADTLVLSFSSSDLSSAVRADLGALKAWHDGQLASVGGQAGALAAQATGAGVTLANIGLTLSTVETVRVLVDGQEVQIESLLNEAPVIQAASFAGFEDQPLSGQIAATDANGDTLSYSVVTGPDHGQLTLDAATGAFTYQGAANFSGADTITVSVNDGRGGVSTQVIDLAIGAVADAPALAVASVGGNTINTSQTINGTEAGEAIYGGAGRDTIFGAGGNDIIYGGSSKGTVTVPLEISVAHVDVDGSESLALSLSGLPVGSQLSAGIANADGTWSLTAADLPGLTVTTSDAASFEVTVTATTLEATGETATTTATIPVALVRGKGNDEIDGGDGDDWISGGNGKDTLAGGAGNDEILGNTGDDKIAGGDGNDTLHGNDGNDTMSGDAGSDVMDGGKGNDVMSGGDGDDSLHGNSGNDVLSGGAGNDVLNGDSGNDKLSDGDGNDNVQAGSGDDIVTAGLGDDVFNGGSGFDTIDFSGAANAISVNLAAKSATGMGSDAIQSFESVIGSAFNDTLVGDKYANHFEGGYGSDVFTGGAGADTFEWSRNDLNKSAGQRPLDHITDFNAAEDVIDLSHVGSHGAAPGDVRVKDTANGTVVSVNLGSGYIDVVQLDGVHGLAADGAWLLN